VTQVTVPDRRLTEIVRRAPMDTIQQRRYPPVDHGIRCASILRPKDPEPEGPMTDVIR
jgi:hypothetical protein